jgi:hypothetical protein
LEDAKRLAALRDQIALLEGETVFEGWAAERLGRDDRQPGLALLTNWRLIVADISGDFFAVPIGKIVRIDLSSPTTVHLTAWHEAISLDFESAACAATLVNCLRQDLERQIAIGQWMDRMARPPRETAAADTEPRIDNISGASRPREVADQRLLMAEPSL